MSMNPRSAVSTEEKASSAKRRPSVSLSAKAGAAANAVAINKDERRVKVVRMVKVPFGLKRLAAASLYLQSR